MDSEGYLRGGFRVQSVSSTLKNISDVEDTLVELMISLPSLTVQSWREGETKARVTCFENSDPSCIQIKLRSQIAGTCHIPYIQDTEELSLLVYLRSDQEGSNIF